MSTRNGIKVYNLSKSQTKEQKGPTNQDKLLGKNRH
jgi:hypothetical protein